MPSSYSEPIEKRLETPDLKAWEQMVASGSGAVLTSLFMTPFDVVKIRLQAQTKAFSTHKCFLFCNGVTEHLCACGLTHADAKKFSTSSGHVRLIPSPGAEWFRRPSNFSGTLDAFGKIVRNEGVSSLWSGLPPTLFISVPNVMIYFTSYEALKDRLHRLHYGVARFVSGFSVPSAWSAGLAYSYPTDVGCSFPAKAVEKARSANEQVSEEMPFWVPLAAGGIARTIAVSCTNPIELVRTKMQSERLKYREISTALKLLIRHKGITGLWMGLPPTLMRDVPFSAIYWTSLEALKSTFNQTQPNPSFVFFAGALSGGLAAVVTLPFDIVKTHRQIALGDAELYAETPSQSKRMTTILRDLYRANGVRALFTGLTPRLLKVMPACAIMISSYEAMKIVFHPPSSKEASP